MPNRRILRIRNVSTALIFLVFSLTLNSSAASTISIAGVEASSTFATYDLQNLINGAGLTGDLHSGDFEGKWMTNRTPTGFLIFDLGAVLNVASSNIWNYGEGCCSASRSTQDLNVEASLDGMAFFNVGNYILNQPIGLPIASETIALEVNARYIKFNLNSNYGDPEFIGLSEVQFSTIPVPATVWLFGSALIGLVGYSRRKSNA